MDDGTRCPPRRRSRAGDRRCGRGPRGRTHRHAGNRTGLAESNKFHEGIGQALHYGDVTGQQPVLALISAYYNIFGAEQQKLEYVSGLSAAHGIELWALTTERQ